MIRKRWIGVPVGLVIAWAASLAPAQDASTQPYRSSPKPSPHKLLHEYRVTEAQLDQMSQIPVTQRTSWAGATRVDPVGHVMAAARYNQPVAFWQGAGSQVWSVCVKENFSAKDKTIRLNTPIVEIGHFAGSVKDHVAAEDESQAEEKS